jgi:hypothetical protein
MKNSILIVPAIVALALVASCGGGDGDPAAGTSTSTTATSATDTTATSGVVDKYVGTWIGPCVSVGASEWEREAFTITKTGDTTFTFSSVNSIYASSSCSGTPTRSDSGTGTGTMRGTKTIGTDTVDKIDIVENGTVHKEVVLIKDGKLYNGRAASEGGSVDSEGYPATLETNGNTRQ